MTSTLHIFGIRHHGPGSARSLVAALNTLTPDIVLIEGPPDAQDVVHLASSPDMHPPVALLIYDPASPCRAAYYPFAEFSPEWQGLRYASDHSIPARFIDLPQAYQLTEDEADKPTVIKTGDDVQEIRRDPLSALARAAGSEDGDGERWWERMVEQRRGGTPEELFAAVLEAMKEVRDVEPLRSGTYEDVYEARRESWMRRSIRTALSEGFAKIAVVCGAWHAPVFTQETIDASAKSDKAVLAKLPKPLKVAATWVPWTFDRLAIRSGYGAGIQSPGWYDHLWHSASGESEVRYEHVATGWMIKVANHLRAHDLDSSPAHVIESVRLAECLASVRGYAIPGLAELNEATQTVMCFGSDVPMRLIREQLIVGERLGAVPPETPMVPLQRDLQASQKRLRLAPEISYRQLDLDLRKENDLARSHLLHRLRLLDISWGTPERGNWSAKGTFHELWRLQWKPEFEVALIAAGVWGNTIEDATAAFCVDMARHTDNLPSISKLLETAMLADIPSAVRELTNRLEELAAGATDIPALMSALPPLVSIGRYGDVRKTDGELVAHVVSGLIVRICVGFPGACSSLNDEAAAAMYTALVQADSSISLLRDVEYDAMWRQALRKTADVVSVNGLIAGRCVRLLNDRGDMEKDDVARYLGLGLSTANNPAHAASWLEGFLRGSGLVLIHDSALWNAVDDWLSDLSEENFMSILPLIRRTFATFTAPERREMGERARKDHGLLPSTNVGVESQYDLERAKKALPLIASLLGAENVQESK